MPSSPGPWRWGSSRYGADALVDANGNAVAHARGNDDDVVTPNDADAALIASAPDLAAQLAEAVALLRFFVGMAPIGPTHPKVASAAAFLARLGAK